jgi:hypothetical protein
MIWARRFWLRLQTLFRRNRIAQMLDDEIQFHLEQQIAENLAAGLSPQEARHAAMRTFGNPHSSRNKSATHGVGSGSNTSYKTCAMPFGCLANLQASRRSRCWRSRSESV